MSNEEIASELRYHASELSRSGNNMYRIRAFRQAAMTILALLGLLLLNGIPGGSAGGNLLVLGSAVAQSFQIASMERFAPRYDVRALTFLQMAVSCACFSAIALSRGELSRPPSGSVWYALIVTGVFAASESSCSISDSVSRSWTAQS